jgi:hypothetical protein
MQLDLPEVCATCTGFCLRAPLLAIAMTLAVPTTDAHAQNEPRRPLVLPGLYSATIGLQTLDTTLTLAALGANHTERNPAMRSVVKYPPVFVALKAGVTAGSILAAERLWKSNRRVTAVVLMVTTTSIMATVAAHNIAVLR